MSAAFRPLLLTTALLASGLATAQDAAELPATSGRDAVGDRVRAVERDGGRVLQAEPMQRGGREVYRLKVLTPEGRVRVLDDPRGAREPRRPMDREHRLDSARHSPMLRDRERIRAPRPAPESPPPASREPRGGDQRQVD